MPGFYLSDVLAVAGECGPVVLFLRQNSVDYSCGFEF